MNGYIYDLFLKPIEHLSLKSLRKNLINKAQGKILEIGIGTGANIPYYRPDVELKGIDPDKKMLKVIGKKVREKNISIESADAENLAYPDNTYDTVVATLVFCSIHDPKRALEEVHRVLRPGGTFLLLEHVRKDTLIMGPLLDRLTPLWSRVAGGYLNRNPKPQIIDAGFEIISEETFWGGLGKNWILRKPLP